MKEAVHPTETSLLEAVECLAPLVEQERENLDASRALPPVLGEALADAGLFRFWIPEALGGAEVDAGTALRLVARVSELDGSVGWNTMIAGAYGFFAGRLASPAAEKIFGEPRAAVAGSLAPTGRAAVTPDGYRVTGRWRFGSGSAQATWFLAQCLLEQDGQLLSEPPLGLPKMRLMFVPADQCEIHDTWHVSGLRGTGSQDYSLDQALVGEEFAADMFAGEPTRPGTLYACPAMPLMTAIVAAVPIGIARNAVRTYQEIAAGKGSVAAPTTPLRDDPAGQAGLARASVLVRSAERVLFGAIEDLFEQVDRGETPSLEDRAQVAMACVHSGESCAKAVDLVYELLGSASIFETHAIERCFRDVHAATQHVSMSWRRWQSAGRVLFGLDPAGLL